MKLIKRSLHNLIMILPIIGIRQSFNSGVSKALTLTAPNGGETVTGGDSYNITWTSSGVSFIDLYYSIDNGSNYTLIAAAQPAGAGTYAWTVPGYISTLGLVKIIENGGVLQDTSDSNFNFTINSLLLSQFYYNALGDALAIKDLISTGRTITINSTDLTHTIDNEYKGANNASLIDSAGTGKAALTITAAASTDLQAAPSGITAYMQFRTKNDTNYNSFYWGKRGGAPTDGWQLQMIYYLSALYAVFIISIAGTDYTAAFTLSAAAETDYIVRGVYNPGAGTATVNLYKRSDGSLVGTNTVSSIPNTYTGANVDTVLYGGDSNTLVVIGALGYENSIVTADQWTAILNCIDTDLGKGSIPSFIDKFLTFESDGSGGVKCKCQVTSEVLTTSNPSHLTLINGYNGTNNAVQIATPNDATVYQYFSMAAALSITAGRTIIVRGAANHTRQVNIGTGRNSDTYGQGGYTLMFQRNPVYYSCINYTGIQGSSNAGSLDWFNAIGRFAITNYNVSIWDRKVSNDTNINAESNANKLAGEYSPQPRYPEVNAYSGSSGALTTYLQYIVFANSKLSVNQCLVTMNYLDKYAIE